MNSTLSSDDGAAALEQPMSLSLNDVTLPDEDWMINFLSEYFELSPSLSNGDRQEHQVDSVKRRLEF